MAVKEAKKFDRKFDTSMGVKVTKSSDKYDEENVDGIVSKATLRLQNSLKEADELSTLPAQARRRRGGRRLPYDTKMAQNLGLSNKQPCQTLHEHDAETRTKSSNTPKARAPATVSENALPSTLHLSPETRSPAERELAPLPTHFADIFKLFETLEKVHSREVNKLLFVGH